MPPFRDHPRLGSRERGVGSTLSSPIEGGAHAIRSEDHRRRPDRVPERLHVGRRRPPRSRRGRDGLDAHAGEREAGRRRGARRGGHRDPRADQLRRRLPRDHRSPVRHPRRRGRQQGVRQRHVGSGHRRRPGAAGRRHRHRGQARSRHVRQHEPRLHPAEQGHQDGRARRVPDELLRRVDHAERLREGLRCRDADRLRRGDLAARARQRDPVRLPDVLAAR